VSPAVANSNLGQLVTFLGNGLVLSDEGAWGLGRSDFVSAPDAPGGIALRVRYPAGTASPSAAGGDSAKAGGTQAYLRFPRPRRHRISAGRPDGVLTVWVNGRQVFSQSGLTFRRTNQLHIDGLFSPHSSAAETRPGPARRISTPTSPGSASPTITSHPEPDSTLCLARHEA
jgi:hypothetical protein